jgi:hypothetical protein
LDAGTAQFCGGRSIAKADTFFLHEAVAEIFERPRRRFISRQTAALLSTNRLSMPYISRKGSDTRKLVVIESIRVLTYDG